MKRNHAFTLIELLAVIAIIAILAALLFPVLGGATERGNRARCLANLREWGSGLKLYLADNNGIFPEESIGKPGVPPIASYTNAWFNVMAKYMGVEELRMSAARARPPRPRDRSIFMCPSLREETVTDEAGSTVVVGERDVIFAYAINLWVDQGSRAAEHGGESGFGTRLRMSQVLKPSKFAVFGEVASKDFDNMASYHLMFRHDGTNFANICMADGHVQAFFRTNVYVSRSEGNAKQMNRGVIWDPEGTPPQTDPIW
jgi:prepilin-type N-terminal cleavage/methylation domain-containing protein/prepilin-type processing-associated H-X9-DG protein